MSYDPEKRKGARVFSRAPAEYRICTHCIMDTSDPEIEFDESGVCSHCHDYDRRLAEEVHSGPAGRRLLDRYVAKIRNEGKGKRYDCVLGLSGGVDSTYVAYLTKKLGLRPLAVHLDNGWNSEIAVRNIENIVSKLGLDLYTVVLDWEEFRRLQVAFLRASTPDSEIPTDHAIVATLYKTAIQNGVRWIIEGSNVVTEVMVPATWSHGHSDWRYIKHLSNQFGGVRLKRYPHYSHFDYLIRFPEIKKVQRFPILNYIDFDKHEAMDVMKKELGWEPYGGKHCESIYTRFYQGYILPTKFGFDKRRSHLSCLVKSGLITREQAVEQFSQPPIPKKQLDEDRTFVLKKLGLSEEEFEEIMSAERKTFWDYPSYEMDVPRDWRWKLLFAALSLPARARAFARIARVLVTVPSLEGGPQTARHAMPANPTFHPGHSAAKRTAWILSFTPVTDEPRVRRQAATLLEAGWNVVVAGYAGHAPKPRGWNWIELPTGVDSPRWQTVPPLVNIGMRILWGIWLRIQRYSRGGLLVLSRFVRPAADLYYWAHPLYRHFRRILLDRSRGPARALGCDLVIAHDYFTAPLAWQLARAQGARFAIDCHEYALGQYMHDRRWRWLERPWVHAVQIRYLSRASIVSTVCEGIARLLEAEYPLRDPVVVLRSTPPYQKMPFRPTGETITVLYHGILSPIRGLDFVVESVPLWHPEFRLVIRGSGPGDYVEALKARAQKLGIADRVTVEPPVPFDSIIEEANRSDIGYFVHEDVSHQKHFALPNKFFEYIMAGLALCVSDLPEMARIVRHYDLGRCVSGADPETIAASINAFDRSVIDECKQRSLLAAKDLCWENESRGMLEAYERFFRDP